MIQKRTGPKGTRWRVIVYGKRGPNGERDHRSSTHDTRAEAKRAETEYELELSQGFTTRDSVEGYLNRWQQGRETRVAATTWTRQGDLLKTALPHIGRIKLRDLEPDDLEALYSTLLKRGGSKGQGLAPRTVHHIHALLHKALQDAARRGVVARNVAAIAQPPRVPPTGPKIPDPHAAQRAVAVLRQTRLWPLIAIMYTTGARRGEVCALTWNNVDLDRGEIYIQRAAVRVGRETQIKEPKTSRSRRRVTLPSATVDILRAWKADQRVEMLERAYRNPGDYVLTNLKGEPVTPNALTTNMRSTCRRKGVPMLTPHMLRHMHASDLLLAGVHPKVAQTRLGHSTIATTLDVYSHLIDGAQDSATEAAGVALGRVMGGNKED